MNKRLLTSQNNKRNENQEEKVGITQKIIKSNNEFNFENSPDPKYWVSESISASDCYFLIGKYQKYRNSQLN